MTMAIHDHIINNNISNTQPHRRRHDRCLLVPEAAENNELRCLLQYYYIILLQYTTTVLHDVVTATVTTVTTVTAMGYDHQSIVSVRRSIAARGLLVSLCILVRTVARGTPLGKAQRN